MGQDAYPVRFRELRLTQHYHQCRVCKLMAGPQLLRAHFIKHSPNSPWSVEYWTHIKCWPLSGPVEEDTNGNPDSVRS